MNGLNAITETFTGNIAEAALPRQTSKLSSVPFRWCGSGGEN